MTDILFLVVARNVGGLEKRFSTPYHLLQKDCQGINIKFIVSKAQYEKLSFDRASDRNSSLKIVVLGCTSKLSDLFPTFEKVWRIFDYISFLFYLIFIQRSVKTVYYVTVSSQMFSRFITAQRSIVALVGSNNPKSILGLSSFANLLKKGAIIDCLSPSIKEIALNHLDIRDGIRKRCNSDERRKYENVSR